MKTKEAKSPKTEIPMNDIERLAVARAMGSNDAISDIAKKISPGNYTGTVALRVDFMLAKGESTEAAPTCDLLSLAVIGRMLQKISPQKRQNFYRDIRSAALDAFASGDKVGDVVSDEYKQVVAEIENLKREVIAQLPMKKRAGATRVQATVAKVTLVGSTQELVSVAQQAA